MRFVLIFAACAAFSSGCSKTETVGPTPAADAGAAPVTEADSGVAGACDAAGPVLTKLTTEDGVTLTSDLTTTGTRKGPAVVLLHMIPPSNDRSNYPAAFISALVARGMSVLNVDRRGAGGSGGVARDAYTGAKGALDAKAAVAFLGAHGCAFDPSRIALVGASNGTTTAIDYAVSSEPAPKALVFLTGGTYTENQTKLAGHRALLDAIPSLFVFSTEESAWSKGFATGAPSAWRFDEYPSGAHGTAMFAAAPASVDAVATFLATSLGATK